MYFNDILVFSLKKVCATTQNLLKTPMQYNESIISSCPHHVDGMFSCIFEWKKRNAKITLRTFPHSNGIQVFLEFPLKFVNNLIQKTMQKPSELLNRDRSHFMELS
jgi:hypothetical protein